MKNILLFIFILLYCVGCINEIPSPLNNPAPKLIINTLLEAEKEENEIFIAMTDKNEPTFIEDALIDIYINGELKEQLTTSAEDEIYMRTGKYLTSIQFVPQDIIRIEARTRDGEHFAWAETTLPTPVSIEKIDTLTILQEYDRYYLRMKTTFTDNGIGTNYYRILAKEIDSYYGKSSLTGNDTTIVYDKIYRLEVDEDIVLTDGRPGINGDDVDILKPIDNRFCIFDNSRINGTYTMTTGLYYYSPDNDWNILDGIWELEYIERTSKDVEVMLISISKEQFFYLKTLNLYYSDSYDDYLSLPIKYYSNVEGGTGIIGSSIQTSMTFNVYDVDLKIE